MKSVAWMSLTLLAASEKPLVADDAELLHHSCQATIWRFSSVAEDSSKAKAVNATSTEGTPPIGKESKHEVNDGMENENAISPSQQATCWYLPTPYRLFQFNHIKPPVDRKN